MKGEKYGGTKGGKGESSDCGVTTLTTSSFEKKINKKIKETKGGRSKHFHS